MVQGFTNFEGYLNIFVLLDFIFVAILFWLTYWYIFPGEYFFIVGSMDNWGVFLKNFYLHCFKQIKIVWNYTINKEW